MSAFAPRQCGLPFVPQPGPDELLGSWLLRIAQLYGLGLTTLLSRLGALTAGDGRLPHWFAIDCSSVSCDALFAALRLPQATLATMAPSPCRPRWPEQLGACKRCLAAATHAGQPITWNRRWMNPLVTACSVHGSWLTPVHTGALARVRHAGDLGSVVHHIATAQALPDDEAARASDALWLQGLCAARTTVPAPWGAVRPQDFVRIVDAVAREVIAALDSGTDPLGLPADRRQGAVKNFAFEICNGERVGVTLPTQLRHRQRVMASVAHVLRLPKDERAYFSSWSAASITRLASMRGEPDGALAWICPAAADLVRQQDALRRQFSISPRYFKACAVLVASIC